MDRLRVAAIAILLLGSALAAQAKITVNGPAQTGATQDRVVAILFIAFPASKEAL